MNKVPLQRDFIRKDFSKMCTSKLNKRDMEDKYFSLLENNLQLKKTINEQREHLKILTTKISRITAAQSCAPKNEKNCCTNYKCIINEQKDVIQDLMGDKEKLMLKIKQLTMKLCSTKQFLRSNLNHSVRARSSRGVNTTKDSIPSVLNSKRTEYLHLPKSPTNGLPSIEEEDLSSVKSSESDCNNKDKTNTEKLSDVKRHRTEIEELKQKIVNLQEELSATHKSYVARIDSLQSEMSQLIDASSSARLASAASQQDMRRRREEAERLAAQLRALEAHTCHLKIQLSIERKKVLEMETQLKAEHFSKEVSKIIVKHLHDSTTKIEHSKTKDSDTIARSVQEQTHSNTSNLDVSVCKCSVTSNEHLNRINEELQKTIILLQTKLDQLKVSSVAQSIHSPKNNKIATYDNSDSEVSVIKNEETHKVNINYGNKLERTNVRSIESNAKNLSKIDVNVGTSGLELDIKSNTIHKDTTSANINVLSKNGASKFSKPPKDNIDVNEKHFASTPNSEVNHEKPPNHLPKTYTIEASDKKKNRELSTSSDNTDYDVSSISEACSPKRQTNSVKSLDHSRSTCLSSRSQVEYLSLGEDRGISTLTEEFSVTSLEHSFADKSQGYLSDGEIPSGKRHLSGTENGLKKTFPDDYTKLPRNEETKTELINVTLQQVTEELARCRHIQQLTKLALCNTQAK